MVISRHSAERCPIHNEEERKLALETFDKWGELAKRLGIKVLGDYHVIPEHTEYLILEASSEAFQKSMTEPFMMQFLSHHMTEVKSAMTMEEASKYMPS